VILRCGVHTFQVRTFSTLDDREKSGPELHARCRVTQWKTAAPPPGKGEWSIKTFSVASCVHTSCIRIRIFKDSGETFPRLTRLASPRCEQRAENFSIVAHLAKAVCLPLCHTTLIQNRPRVRAFKALAHAPLIQNRPTSESIQRPRTRAADSRSPNE
jgi:hypothetical protein